jgi:hypothetical protein
VLDGINFKVKQEVTSDNNSIKVKLVDEIFPKISDEQYLQLMNNLKIIFDNLTNGQARVGTNQKTSTQIEQDSVHVEIKKLNDTILQLQNKLKKKNI